MTHDVEAYLAPADVLICSKCMGIGHFRKQCTEAEETCKVCGTSCPDLRQHKCSTVIKCIHCDGDHHSNALKCPIVKSYRATLTKKLLSANRPPPPHSAWSNNNGNININNNTKYQHNWADYPQLPPPQKQNIPYSTASNEMINKIGELIGTMQKINDVLVITEKKNQEFEQFIIDSKSNDASLSKKLDQLNEKDKDYKKVHTQHDIKLSRHENVFTKLVLPMLDEIAKFMVNINLDKNLGVLNADFQVTINRMRAQLTNNSEVAKESERMCELAADHFENFFREPDNIYRPHPYTDAPEIEWENYNEEIPPVTIEEILDVVHSRKNKKSCDAHGLSNFMFSSLPVHYWSLLLQIFNLSLSSTIAPKQWKDIRVLLPDKNESICDVTTTRPISLLDVFLKVDEKLFLTRFNDLLKRRGILPDTQSGFRPGFRLQTCLLLFLEQVSSLMANSSPVATVFVDFKAAFDQLWFDGCIGKLKKMGILRAYLRWINT
ncbi:unnamed protein product [Rotaria socialis]|uniref:Reverse transcriptase domain-containing protein n=2 Tax=Rotaria socialis TaxID=392032 RepID=A0A820TJV7_9BILA|nr:unnamed protein product [Rotaria socialis]CAF4501087.1 unnamed protein product [Rotaria socialis]